MMSGAAIIADPRNIVYEVWRGGDFLGVLTLTKVVPAVDAVVHFVFMDRENLKGKRQFLLNFLGSCYRDMGFTRLTFELPEGHTTLIRFVRRHLGFTYEGERAILEGPTQITDNLKGVEGWATWAARVGSRRERAHWSEAGWVDVMILRQTAPEFLAFIRGPEEG